ncbi:MAG: SUMF1/EgtB/PvdO family nonheme iron enzyme [Bacteroidales bacterium]|nr:SUMF1/EgtB/PvdO family nonheme iron enzyme [Bacteroidales bacterium]
MSLHGIAQQISVASFERRDNDMDARVNYPVKDQNGDVCALIKVETTQTGFVFEGGSLGIMKTERKTGEYWVYIPWGSKRITIKHDQLGILRDYTFPESIEKATVYLMKLTTGKVTVVVEEPEILTQWVVITSTPDGAQVYVDDKPVGNTPFSREYSLGQHNYRVEMPMYHADAGVFTLDGASDKVRVTSVLKPNFGSISVNSSPESGADVLLDGKPTGQKTPCTLTEILSGNHRITIKKTMYYDAWQEVTVEDDKTATAALTMNPAYGELDITTNPSADIYIDDVKVGSGSYSVRKSSGFYTVEARKEKHTPDSKKVEVTDGQTIPVALAPVPQYGTLKISTTPPDAEIYLDGVKKGTTPTTIRQLLVGDYNIELRMQGYAGYNAKTTIKQNETTEISETLQNGMQVTITSTPAGATLEIDGASMGNTPYSGNLSFGNHIVKLTNNAKVVNENISITQGGKTSWSFDVSETKDFTETVSGIAIEMVSIKGGTFTMGSPSSEADRGSDETQHQVTVSDFYMGKYEVTFEQYDAFCTATGRTKPSDQAWGRGKRPVINVSWNDATAYCEWLSRQTGKNYRLPTEAEWEYACRAGTSNTEVTRSVEVSTPFNTGNCLSTSQANYNGNYPYGSCSKGEYRQKTLPVGSFSANAYGLYDMHGNVWEWCSDWYGDYSTGAQTNPKGAAQGSARVDRGGGWSYYALHCRSARRDYIGPSYSFNFLGFRLVCEIENSLPRTENNNNEGSEVGTFTDSRDGTIYKTVKIGSQTWMAENLRYIPSVVGPTTGSATTKYYYVYDYDGTSVSAAKATANYKTYGVLYNWTAAMDGAASSNSNPSQVKGVCPESWHLPSNAEWGQLVYYLGGADAAGGKLKEMGNSHWNIPNADATNSRGFWALPGGCREDDGSFWMLYDHGYWWSASESGINHAYGRYLVCLASFIDVSIGYKSWGYSVRCVKD